MDANSYGMIELETSQPVNLEQRQIAEIQTYPVAVYGPSTFVACVERGLKRSSVPANTVAFTKTDRKTAESVCKFKPAAILLDSSFASDGLISFILSRGLTIIKMNRETRNTEEFRNEGEPLEKSRGIGEFVERLCTIAAVCVIWEI